MYRKTRKYAHLLCIAAFAMGAGAPLFHNSVVLADPAGELESESGSTHLDFVPSIPAGSLNALSGAVQVDTDAVKALVIKGLNAQAAQIKAIDSDYFTIPYFSSHVDDLTKQAIDQINAAAANLNKQMTDGLDGAISKANTALSAVKPQILITDNYQFHNGHRNPGDPGWTNPPSAQVVHFTNFTTNASFNVGPFSVGLKPLGIGVDFTVGFSVNITFSATASVTGANLDHPQQPSTPVSAIPLITVTASDSFTATPGGITISAGNSTTFTQDLKPATGTLTAKVHN